MEVVLHDDVAEDGEALVGLEETEGIEDDLYAGWAAEDRQPGDNGGREEVRLGLVVDFVTGAGHRSLTLLEAEPLGSAFPGGAWERGVEGSIQEDKLIQIQRDQAESSERLIGGQSVLRLHQPDEPFAAFDLLRVGLTLHH